MNLLEAHHAVSEATDYHDLEHESEEIEFLIEDVLSAEEAHQYDPSFIFLDFHD
jgi:hypothetical protein